MSSSSAGRSLVLRPFLVAVSMRRSFLCRGAESVGGAEVPVARASRRGAGRERGDCRFCPLAGFRRHVARDAGHRCRGGRSRARRGVADVSATLERGRSTTEEGGDAGRGPRYEDDIRGGRRHGRAAGKHGGCGPRGRPSDCPWPPWRRAERPAHGERCAGRSMWRRIAWSCSGLRSWRNLRSPSHLRPGTAPRTSSPRSDSRLPRLRYPVLVPTTGTRTRLPARSLTRMPARALIPAPD